MKLAEMSSAQTSRMARWIEPFRKVRQAVLMHRLRPTASLSMLLLMAGCPGQNSTNDPAAVESPYEGVEVRFAIPETLELAESWAPAINDWADESKATVKIVEFDPADGDIEWLSKTKGQSPALVLLSLPMANELVGRQLLAPIPDEALGEGVIAWDRIPPNVRSVAGNVDGKPTIVPVTCPTPVVAYRADLLRAAGKTPPETWAEYDQLIRDIEDWAPNHVAVEPRDNESLSTLFFARAISGAKHPAQFSVELDTTTGDPLIATAPFAVALEEMKRLTPHLAPDVRTMTPSDCLRAMTSGTAAIGIVWETSTFIESNRTNSDAAADERGTLAFAPLPGRTDVYDRDAQKWVAPPSGAVNRPALCGFDGHAVCVLKSASLTEQSAAWDLWGLLEVYQSEGTITPLPGDAMTAEPTTIALSNDLSPGENQEYGRALRLNLQNPLLVCELPVAGRDQLLQILLGAIDEALRDALPVETALDNAQTQWQSIIETMGRTKVLNNYRRRLGLAALAE